MCRCLPVNSSDMIKPTKKHMGVLNMAMIKVMPPKIVEKINKGVGGASKVVRSKYKDPKRAGGNIPPMNNA